MNFTTFIAYKYMYFCGSSMWVEYIFFYFILPFMEAKIFTYKCFNHLLQVLINFSNSESCNKFIISRALSSASFLDYINYLIYLYGFSSNVFTSIASPFSMPLNRSKCHLRYRSKS